MPSFDTLTGDLQFPEGPIVLADGSILVVEIARETLTRVYPEGRAEIVAELGGGPNGAAIGPDGCVYVCNNGGFEWHEIDGGLVPGLTPESYTGGSIQKVDLQSGSVETLYTECGGEPIKGPNDIVFDSQGGFWFTDNGKRYARSEDIGAVYYAKTDGSFISEQVYPCSHANGIGLSPDEKTLYMAETMAGRIKKFALPEPGQAIVPEGLLNPEPILYGAPGYDLYDSLAIEANGNICVATLSRGGITVLSPDGALIDFVALPDPAVTNIAFGGPDMKTAYITLSLTGRLIKMDWPRRGLKLPFNA
ncbi:SMP-30/gluconolactonase/LRE family protein [Parasphingopyxis algicola]|uniref:SMP-30/gluconolactonase/LRE family protein n=1 Tax=Parasphingopyxis algicola TaxID=2026624 RepID=UPI0015A1A97F|nr:SMP-30/gluconolactonase/LRE family protein [Parasphingopyxis algicola]QLC26498.1 SMP-30/gluconolactonase/LRE family protein [Parasphingopyxis algicola]